MCRLNNLIDEGKCYEEVRRIRWPNGGCCPACTSNKIAQRGRNHRQQECRRYTCKNCGKRFDDLTGTVFMGRHQPWSVWFADLYLMGLNGSNRPMAEESNLNESDGQAMAEALRGGWSGAVPPCGWAGWWNATRGTSSLGIRAGPIGSRAARHAVGGSRAHPVKGRSRRKSRRFSG